MIIYRVECKIHQSEAERWKQYFIDIHLVDVLNTGCFTGYSFQKEMIDETETVTFISEYYCPDMETLERYNQEFAAVLKADIYGKFSNYTCVRNIYEKII